jgi:hypothetical protein
MIPEYLIALFLIADREKDITKIEMLLKQAEVDMEKLKKILIRYNLDEKFNKIFKEKQNE